MQRADGTPVIVLPEKNGFIENGSKTQRLPSDSTIARSCSEYKFLIKDSDFLESNFS